MPDEVWYNGFGFCYQKDGLGERNHRGKKSDALRPYLNAKHELDVWMTAHGRHGLLELLDKLNAGADFTTAYDS